MSSEFWRALFENNPGIITIFFTGILFPLIFVLLNNGHARRIRELEKELDVRYNSKEDVRKQEKIVFSSLTKILFDIQQLHVNLSGSCADKNCIPDALKKFDDSVTKCHSDISGSMLVLSSKAINHIYLFYNEVSSLKIMLKEINENSFFELAQVQVYQSSQKLAIIVMDIQELFLDQRSELRAQFDRTQQEMMKYCCGQEPPREIVQKYEALKVSILSRGA